MPEKNLEIRSETEQDFDGIQKVHDAAFERDEEGLLVNALREAKKFTPEMSLVALEKNRIVGHILFSEIDLKANERRVKAVALAPMAVHPRKQRKGVGKELVQKGLDNIRELGYEAVLVYGDRRYYEQFGFSTDYTRKIRSVYGGPHFLGLELTNGSLDRLPEWEAVYPKEFEIVG